MCVNAAVTTVSIHQIDLNVYLVIPYGYFFLTGAIKHRMEQFVLIHQTLHTTHKTSRIIKLVFDSGVGSMATPITEHVYFSYSLPWSH